MRKISKIKIPTPEQWLNLATYKDTYRPNLRHPYCSGDEIVSTDGHRMHIVKLDQPGTKGYIGRAIDNGDTFPDYKHVWPEKFTHSLTSSIGLEEVKKLKALLAYGSAFNPSKDMPVFVRLSPTEKDKNLRVLLSLNARCGGGSIVLPIEYKGEEIGVNLSYLIDAIIPTRQFTWSFSGQDSGMVIEYSNLKYTSLIMPVRLEW